MRYDLIVIGGGPGGYVAAIKASQFGKKVALVEKDALGGTCLNRGCIPTKSLLASAHLFESIKDAAKMGIDCSEPKVNMSAMVRRSRQIVANLGSGLNHLMQKNKITVYKGHGKVVTNNLGVTVGDIHLLSDKIIIATGARNRPPRGINPDGVRIWDSTHALSCTEVPKSMIIVGAGAIGLEFASFFASLGSEVKVVEYADRIARFADKDISKAALDMFKNKGIQFMLNTGVESIESAADRVTLSVSTGEVYSSEICLIATGIVGNTEDLGLEKVKVQVEKGHIVVNCKYQTGEPGIYAIGDVLREGPWLAHKAMQDAIRCVEGIFKDSDVPNLSPDSVPVCVYSSPEIAQIGLTEDQAIALGKKVKTATYPFSANGKALTENNNGFVKVILEENGIFVGAHMIGEHVTELINSYSLIKHLEAVSEDIKYTTFAHPTLSEVIQEAVLAASGYGIHV